MAGGLLGPALTVYNDETFSEQDFQNITNTGDSGKRQVRHDSFLWDMTLLHVTKRFLSKTFKILPTLVTLENGRCAMTPFNWT